MKILPNTKDSKIYFFSKNAIYKGQPKKIICTTLISVLLIGVAEINAMGPRGDDSDTSFIANRPIYSGERHPPAVTGLIYNIECRLDYNMGEGRSERRGLDSNGNEVYLNPRDGENHWRQWSIIRPEGERFYALWHRESGGYLDAREELGVRVIQISDKDRNNRQRWVIYESLKGPFFRIYNRHLKQNLVADGRIFTDSSDLFNDNRRKWSLHPTHYKLEGVIRDFRVNADVTTLLNQRRGPIKTVICQRIENNADVEIEKGICYTEVFENAYSMDFKESEAIHTSANFKVEVKADGLLGVFAVSARAKAEFNWDKQEFKEEHRHRETREEVTFGINEVVRVGPHKKVEIVSTIDGIEGLQVPFTSIMGCFCITGYKMQ